MLFLTSCATEKVHVCAADSLSSTMTVYNYIKKNKNADLTHNGRLAGELAIAESITAKDPNYVDTFGLDFAFSFANILSLIAFIISYRLFADELVYALRDVAAWLVYVIIGNLQCYLTICAILADYEEQVLLTGVKKNRYCMRCTKHYNFNIHMSLVTDTLHLLLKGLVIKMLDFMQDMLDDIYSGSRKTWDNSTTLLVAVVSLLFILKAPFALHFIRAVCDLVTLAQYKNIRMYRALDGIYTRANSEAHYITIVKQFYSIINKKEKHIAYIRAFSKVLLFNNNRQIDNTTRMLTFKFYDLSTIICLVHLVLRDLPNLTTRTTMSYYVNNYID
ncbi:hypothetical protein HBH49_197310 [Parastagonospora nodorum]|nr:hypothetical protein HBH49_197310 [Parastagonospora nodorum]